MPNLNRNMLFFLLFTVIFATGNCFVSSMIDQPVKLALSLFGGHRGRNTKVASPIPTAPVAASVPPQIYPSAPPTGGARPDGSSSDMIPIVNPTQHHSVEPWKDGSSSGGSVEPWKDNGHQYIASGKDRHQPSVEPGKYGSWGGGHRPAELWKDDSWGNRQQYTGPGKDRDLQRVEPWKDGSWGGGQQYTGVGKYRDQSRVQPWKDGSWGSGQQYTGLGKDRDQFRVEPWNDGSWGAGQQTIETWKDHNLSGPQQYSGPGKYRGQPRLQPWKDDSWSGEHQPEKPWKDESWTGKYKYTGPGKYRQRPRAEPLKDDNWSGEQQPAIPWKDGSWARKQKHTRPGKDRHLPHFEPGKDDKWSGEQQPAIPWKHDSWAGKHKHAGPGKDRHLPRIEPWRDDNWSSELQPDVPWKDHSWVGKQKHTGPGKDRHQSRVEPLNDDLSIGRDQNVKAWKDEGWNVERNAIESSKYWSKRGMQLIPGRPSDDFYDGGWNTRSGNSIPILSIEPWQKGDWNNGDISGKGRKNGDLQEDWQVDSDEQIDNHNIRGKKEAEATARRPVASIKKMPGIRSDFVIITAKPMMSLGKRTYLRSTGYITGPNRRTTKPKKVSINTQEECIWC